MLWGYETIKGGWYRLYNWAALNLLRYGSVITLDWSGFDRYARHSVIRDIHKHVMRPMFTFDEGYEPTYDYPNTEADPTRLENLWNWMTDSILTTPLMLPNGTLIRFRHSGIYSGYFQTQILDSMYNSVMIFTIFSKLGISFQSFILKLQGDDSIILLLLRFLMISATILIQIAFQAKRYFGATLSEKKSEVLPSLEGAEVLKYRNSNGNPYRDEMTLLAMLRFPERKHDYSSLMARTIGIAYADCGKHPRVLQICEDIHEYLASHGTTPDPKGLPEGIRFRERFVPGYSAVDLSHFPSYFETVQHLHDNERPLCTEKHWPLKHFINDFSES